MAKSFAIQPIGRFVGAASAVKRPKEIACFSYDENHVFRLDDSSIRYYHPPRLGSDLCKGFDTFEKLDDTADDHLDSLLKAIISYEQGEGKKLDVDFITWRGMMTKIVSAIFSDRDGFEMNATQYQGTIFIEENHEYKRQSQAMQSRQPTQPGRPSQDMMSYWGYKFETLCLIPEPWSQVSRDYIEGRGDHVVNNHAQYCSVVRTGFGDTSMVLGGEVDAVWDSKPADPSTTPINWVELKTSLDPVDDRSMLAFERKLMKFWIQSFLLGVPKIIVGFRTQDGILKRVEEMETALLPGQVKKVGKGTWDGNMCISFGASVMAWLKQSISGDGVWRIRRKERSTAIELFKVEETGHGDILSDEFKQWRTSLEATKRVDTTALIE